MLVQCFFVFVAVTSAWVIALMFLQMNAKGIVFNSVAVGLICAAVAFVMLYFEINFDLTLILFIFMAFVIQLQEKNRYENCVIYFAAASSAYSVFRFAQISFKIFLGDWLSYAAALLVIFLFYLATALFKNSFPPADWLEYFAEKTQEEKTINVKSYHIFLLIGFLLLSEVVLIQIITPDTLWSAIALSVVFTLLFWVIIYGICLIVAYKRERLIILVEKQYRDEMQTFMNVIRSQRHDYNFHVHTLSGILKEGNIEDCRRYLDNLVQDSIEMNTVLPIKDLAISSLINSFRIIAIQRGIELHIDIQNDLSLTATNVYETNKIIGNLLQNAIDETEVHKDKSYGIYLYILKRGEFCLIRVANKLSEKPEIEQYLKDIYKHGYTTKAGHEGVGLSSIKSLLTRHKGVVYTRIEGDVINFVAKIPIKYPEEVHSDK